MALHNTPKSSSEVYPATKVGYIYNRESGSSVRLQAGNSVRTANSPRFKSVLVDYTGYITNELCIFYAPPVLELPCDDFMLLLLAFAP